MFNTSEKPTNGEEMAISRVGKELYEMLIRPYTKKQWDKYPKVSCFLSQRRNPMSKTIAIGDDYADPSRTAYSGA